MANLLQLLRFIITQGVLAFLSTLISTEMYLSEASQADPVFLPTPRNVTVLVGELAKLPCRIKNVGSRDVVWRHQGTDHFLTIGKLTWVKDPDIITEHRRQSRLVSDWNLLIKNAQKERTGVYECQVAASKRFAQSVYLWVIDPPSEKPDIYLQGSKYVPVGGEIRLLCNISGRFGAKSIDWFKDGDKIDNDRYKNYIVTRFWTVEDRSIYSELIVDNSQPADSGKFMCRGSENEISSREVVVRVGGSSNVKREYGPEREHEQLQTQSQYNSGHLQTGETKSESSSSSVASQWMVSLVLLILCVGHHAWRT